MCAVAAGLALWYGVQFLAPDVYRGMLAWTGSALDGPMLWLAWIATNAALFAVLWHWVRKRQRRTAEAG